MKEKLKSILRTLSVVAAVAGIGSGCAGEVKNRRFLLIASHGNGGLLLHDLGMQFTMPTV